MLSVENPSSDPPCPHLKSSTDERASHKIALTEVDLPEPALLDENQLPKFSIRDYVSTARRKDIKTNWPFSLKSLQLCLKHGVNDLLPPFQSLDAVRNQCFYGCEAKSITAEDQIISNIHEEPFGSNNQLVSTVQSSSNAQLNQKTEACTGIAYIGSCRSEVENDFPSTTTSVSQSETESVHTTRPSSLPLETDTTQEVGAVCSAQVHKTESTTRPLGKKCRLIVKFGTHTERNSIEDIATNCTAITETMASKVCPVCKTFSSSSNTTLNAHIDQCLSVESTPKWMADSKQTRHRIKPRKTRLMVDIYATAQRCTLEELDRRNGTSWATVSSFPVQNDDKSETFVQGKRQRVSLIHPEDTDDDVGAVYRDANGTKVRFLSKLNDPPSVSKAGEELGPWKSLGGGKGSKFFSTKKKRRHALKRQKYMKLVPESRKMFSLRAHSSRIHQIQEEYEGIKESSEKVEPLMQQQVKLSGSRTLKQWVSSKRTTMVKNVKNKVHSHSLECNWQVSQELVVENPQFADRSVLPKLATLPENLTSSAEEIETMDTTLCELHDKSEQHPDPKSIRSLSFRARISDDVERPLPPEKGNVYPLRKDWTGMHVSHIQKRSNTSRCSVPPSSNKTIDGHASSMDDSEIASRSGTKPSNSYHDFSSKTMRFPSSQKNLLSVGRRSPKTGNKANVIKKSSALKNSQLHVTSEIDEEAWHSEKYIQNTSSSQSGREESSDKIPSGSRTLEIKQTRRAMNLSHRKEVMVLSRSQDSQLILQCYGGDERENVHSSVGVANDCLGNVNGIASSGQEINAHGKEFNVERSANVVIGWKHMTSNESADPGFHKSGNNSETLSNSPPTFEDYEGPYYRAEVLTDPPEERLVDGQEILCTNEVDNQIIGQSTHVGEELVSKIADQHSFPEVDPISIPGPPGSFLPSPGDMGLEEFQENSSLTTSHVQSSQNQHDFFGGDSSDSPISATTTISNSTASATDSKYFKPSIGPHAVQNDVEVGVFEANAVVSVENDAAIRQRSVGVAEIKFSENTKHINSLKEMGPLSFKFYDDQPCCCQKKERLAHSVALSYHESQLVRPGTVASYTMPVMGNQMGFGPHIKPKNLDLMSDVVSRSSCPSLGSNKVVLPPMNSLGGSIPLKVCPDGGLISSCPAMCDSVSPSASNPILRLMGKNLMVVNKNEDAAMPLRQVQPCESTPRFSTISGISPCSTENQEYTPVDQRILPQSSVNLGQDPHIHNNPVTQCYNNTRLSNSFGSNSTLKRQKNLPRVATGLLPAHPEEVDFAASMGTYKHKGNSRKEMVIIDDDRECEAQITTDVVKPFAGLRESQILSPSILIPTTTSFDPRNMNPCVLGESQLVHGRSSLRAIGTPVRWNCTSEGPGVLHQNPFLAGSSTTGHLRSALHHSPSFS
ncbi:Elongation factor G [Quillaja saponaria]|uniref:Elongation factor G n=1 Tax=Quillaja saponaria TaxID=32244 RepID=A0AAD7PPJ8_QUISA|nr:Elongation factor G [Quillaja saponaria]KAJ7963476.1 Elongation factor G [Quillaja saponaria]